MNEASPTEGVAASSPHPTMFAPGASTLPGELAPDAVGTEPFLLLVNTSDDAGWAADTAVAIAAEWAGAGRRVVLADLHLEQPFLHERLGEPNLDGTVDIFLYGASVARSARPPHDQDFFLIPAGTYTATPEDVYTHSRWAKLITGFREAGAVLMAFVPPSVEAVTELSRWGRGAILLGGRPDSLDSALSALDVRGILVPPGAGPAPAADAQQAEIEPPGFDDSAAASEELEVVRDTFDDEARGHESRANDPELADHVWSAGLDETPYSGTSSEQDERSVDARDEAEVELGEFRGRDSPPAWAAGAFSASDPAVREVSEHGVAPTERMPEDARVEAPVDSHSADPAPWERHSREQGGVARMAEADGDSHADAAADRAVVDNRQADEQSAAAGAGGPVVGPGRRRRRGGPGPMIWLLVAVAVIALAVIAVAIARPELFGANRDGSADNPAPAEAIPPPPEAPVPVGDTLPFSVQVRAYVALGPARTQAERQSRRVPEAPFFVVPELTQGVLYYKVMAGALPDTSAATELRRRLVQAGVVAEQDARDDAPGSWSLIQSRPLAFALGEYPERQQATSRADSLTAAGIPAYMLGYPYSDGTGRYRVYAGAYPDSTQAEEMRAMLRAAELPTRLVLRIGQGPTPMQ
jgi:hypothetical protein